jgi:hypothetical protein
VAALVAATLECSPDVEKELFRRYAAAVRLEGSRQAQESALADLRALRRLLERADLQEITYDSLTALAKIPAPSAAAAGRYRRVVRRLIRLLQDSGELPTQKEVRASQVIEQALAAAPAGGRRILRSWLAQRRRTVGWWELRFEAERLQQLELVIASYPGADDNELITRWLRVIVRQIVKCECPPLTRRANPAVCSCCGKTSASAGTRPSPSEPKQREYTVPARRYLEYRRLAAKGRLG